MNHLNIILVQLEEIPISSTLLQSISPGLVRTEFRGRAKRSDDIEASKKEYDDLLEVLLYYTVYVQMW